MCRACVSPVLNHPSLFESPTAFTGLGSIAPSRRGFMAMSTAALLTSECPQCHASGRVLSTETLRIKIQREIFEMTGGLTIPSLTAAAALVLAAFLALLAGRS